MDNNRAGNYLAGQSLVELIVGIGIAAIVLGSVVGAVILSVRINKQSITSNTASGLARELLDDVRSYVGGNWVRLYNVDTKGASTTYIMFSEDTLFSPDALDNAGSYSSLALDDFDNPVIAYYSAVDTMKVMHCNDTGCLGGDESVESVDTGGYDNFMQLDSSGYPVVAHLDNTTGEFKVARCNDPNCNGGDESSQVVTTGVGGFSLQIDGSGYPVISYREDSGHNIFVVHCNDVNCAGGDESIQSLFKTTSAGKKYTSLALSPSTGVPVVAYNKVGNLGITRCNDVNCAGGDEVNTSVDSGASGTAFVSIALDRNEYPVVSYYDSSPEYNLKILHCNDVACAGGDDSVEIVDSTGNTGESTSLQLDTTTPGCSDGCPVVSYIGNDKLKILHCNDPYCAGGDESIVAVDTALPQANVSGTSLRLDSNGNPTVSYYDDISDDLRILHCDDPNCEVGVFTALAVASGTEDIAVDNTTYTRWFSVEDVYRSSTGTIVDSGGTEDPSTQKITAHVTWPFMGATADVAVTEYMTRWTRNVSTVFTGWSGSSGTEGPLTESNANYYSSDNISTSTPGEIKLQ